MQLLEGQRDVRLQARGHLHAHLADGVEGHQLLGDRLDPRLAVEAGLGPRKEAASRHLHALIQTVNRGLVAGRADGHAGGLGVQVEVQTPSARLEVDLRTHAWHDGPRPAAGHVDAAHLGGQLLAAIEGGEVVANRQRPGAAGYVRDQARPAALRGDVERQSSPVDLKPPRERRRHEGLQRAQMRQPAGQRDIEAPVSGDTEVDHAVDLRSRPGRLDVGDRVPRAALEAQVAGDVDLAGRLPRSHPRSVQAGVPLRLLTSEAAA